MSHYSTSVGGSSIAHFGKYVEHKKFRVLTNTIDG
jgi:hypothetical protein